MSGQTGRTGGRRRVRRSESGSATVVTLAAMGMALALTIFLINALLMLYARAVIQHAADVGARIAARSGGTEAACEATAHRTIEELANFYVDDVQVIACARGAAISTAAVTAGLQPLFSGSGPSWTFTIRAASSTEPTP